MVCEFLNARCSRFHWFREVNPNRCSGWFYRQVMFCHGTRAITVALEAQHVCSQCHDVQQLFYFQDNSVESLYKVSLKVASNCYNICPHCHGKYGRQHPLQDDRSCILSPKHERPPTRQSMLSSTIQVNFRLILTDCLTRIDTQ